MEGKNCMTKTKSDKEEKALNIWIPIGVTIGIAVGAILALTLDNLIYLGAGAIVGLLLGMILGSTNLESSTKKKKSK